jgi:hypothetical protein
MVASSTLFAVLAATASLVSATPYGNDHSHEGKGPQEGHKGGEDWQKENDWEHEDNWQKDYSHDGSYQGQHSYSIAGPYKPSSAYSHYSVPSKASHIYSAPSSKTSLYTQPSLYFSHSSAKSSHKSSHIASFAVPTLITKKSVAQPSSSKFVDPFYSASKPTNDFVVPVVPYKTSSAISAKITPAPSFSASKNATTSVRAQTTISLFNAAKGSGNGTCAGLKDITYYASVVSANPTATVLALGCSKRGSLEGEQCFDSPKTVTQGPSLFASADGASKTLSCNIVSRTASASCRETIAPLASGVAVASAGAARQSGVVQLAFSGEQICYHPVVVTAGAEKLGNATVTSRVPTGPSSEFFSSNSMPLNHTNM